MNIPPTHEPSEAGPGEGAGEPGRVAALDYGQARIGVAVADELGLMAHPRDFVPANPPARALRQLASLVKQEGITRLLVGLPRNMDNTEGLAARRARKFALELGRVVSVPIVLVDERLSTVQAQARLQESGLDTKKSRQKIDSASAAILLQTWLDGHQRP